MKHDLHHALNKLQKVEEERNALKSELIDTIETAKKDRVKIKKDKESIDALKEELNEGRKEINNYVEAKEIVLKENKTLKEIRKTKDKIKEMNKKPEEVVEIEDCEDAVQEQINGDIDDNEAARVFLENKRDAE
jgi:hypothetical protein